jgi:hypothetical protein
MIFLTPSGGERGILSYESRRSINRTKDITGVIHTSRGYSKIWLDCLDLRCIWNSNGIKSLSTAIGCRYHSKWRISIRSSPENRTQFLEILKRNLDGWVAQLGFPSEVVRGIKRKGVRLINIDNPLRLFRIILTKD